MDKSLTGKRKHSTIRAMEDLTLGRMVAAKMQELGLDLEAAAAQTGISERHLRRILDDDGYMPQERTREKLVRLGLTPQNIGLGAARSKSRAVLAGAGAF